MATAPPATHSLVGLIFGVHITTITLATVTVLGRVIVRLSLTRGGLGGYEITIVLTLLLAITTVALNLEQTKFGLGQHLANLSPNTNFEEAQGLFYFGQMVYMTTVGMTKIAILILYLRIIPSRTYRYAIYGLMVFVNLTVFACVMADVFQCTPISFTWNKEQNGYCINQVALLYSHAGLNIFQDLVVYVFPMRMLYKLRLPRKQRVALIAIFGVGGFVCITSMLRLSSLKAAVGSSDPTYYNVGAANWSVVETCVGIVCASLVHFKPLVDRFAPRWISSSDDSVPKSACGSSAYSMSRSQMRGPPPRSEYIRQETTVEVEMESQAGSMRRLRGDA